MGRQPPAVDEARGRAFLELLASQPPEQGARHLLEGLRRLQVVSTEELGGVDLYHFAAVETSTPLKDRRAAVRSVVRGAAVGLDPDERRECLILGKQAWYILWPLVSSRVSIGAGEADTAFARNLRVAQTVALRTPAKEGDFSALVQAARDELVVCALDDPECLADLFDDLDEDTRTALLEAVPRESHDAATRVLEPGGYGDQLCILLRVIVAVHEHRLLIAVLPVVELVLSFVMGRYHACSTGLAGVWLTVDALLHGATVFSLFSAMGCLMPLRDALREDAAGSGSRLDQAIQVGSPDEASGLLGVDEMHLDNARRFGIATLALLTLGVPWAIIGGVYAIYAAVTTACFVVAYLVCLVFVASRLGMYIAVIWAIVHVHGQQSDSHDVVGASYSYGSTDIGPGTASKA